MQAVVWPVGNALRQSAVRMLKPLMIVAALVMPVAGLAAPMHGLSAFGDLKYPADFKHFEYVNPQAPKGGRIVTIGTAGLITFDSLNGFILKGDAAQRLDLLFDTLMVRAYDEPDAVYGLVAKSATVAPDGMSVTFMLRSEAKFSDGSSLTSKDVVRSFELLKAEGHPSFRIALRNVEKVQAVAPHEVRFEFTGENVRDLPMLVSGLPVLSSDYYDKVDFTKTTLEPPLGSGPYKVKGLRQGNFISYERRDDYWAKGLPVNVGRYNFDEIKLLYFRDRATELEAIKAGELDLREDFTSKHWATEYNLDSVKEGRLIKATLLDETTSGAQGFFLNMRREKFADPRTREALGLAFDFEWSNTNLFFGLYKRTTSFFENSPLKAVDKPDAAELALLEPLRADLPAATFGEAVVPPVSDGSGQDRKLLRKANQLLSEAGWKRQGRQLVNAKGEPLTVEFLIFSPTMERIISPFVRNLKLLGVDASIRQVEAAQYQERLKNFDFDVTTRRSTMSQTPGVELETIFASRNADMRGSSNLPGLKSKGVDELINHVIQAKDRESLTIAVRALDRALRAHYLWVPHWFKAAHNVAHWDIFGQPDSKPPYTRGILDTWWIDADKAKKIKRGS
ncbi:MAG: extracellular solute-binding protein [Burkholderiaceae bacterium]